MRAGVKSQRICISGGWRHLDFWISGGTPQKSASRKSRYQFSTKTPEPVFFFMFPLGNPHTKPRRFFPKNCPGHPPKQPTTQQSFFHLRLPGPTASATLTVGSCKHSGQEKHTHAERWALWPGLKRADRDWGAEDIFPAPPLPGTKKRVKIANKRSPLSTHRTP